MLNDDDEEEEDGKSTNTDTEFFLNLRNRNKGCFFITMNNDQTTQKCVSCYLRADHGICDGFWSKLS